MNYLWSSSSINTNLKCVNGLGWNILGYKKLPGGKTTGQLSLFVMDPRFDTL